MHTENPVAVAVSFNTDCVVEILRVRRVNCDNHLICNIFPLCSAIRAESFRRAARLLDTAGVKLSWNAKLHYHRCDFGIILPRPAQNFQYDPVRNVSLRRIRQYFNDDLVLFPRVLRRNIIDRNRLGKCRPVRLNIPLRLLFQQRPDKPVMRPFENLGNLTAASLLAAAYAFFDDPRFDNIASHRPSRIRWRYEQIAVVVRL